MISLNDIHNHLEGLPGFQQHHVVVLRDTTSVTLTQEWLRTMDVAGNEHVLLANPVAGRQTEDFFVQGKAYAYSVMDDERVCFSLFQDSRPQLSFLVTDLGFMQPRNASLVAESVLVNGVLSDHYVFDEKSESLHGDVFIAQQGGYIVRYEVLKGNDAASTLWQYNLDVSAGGTSVELPSACSTF